MSNNLAQADELEVLLHHSSSTNFSALSDLLRFGGGVRAHIFSVDRVRLHGHGLGHPDAIARGGGHF